MKKTIIQFCIVSILALSAAPGALAAEDDPGMLEIFSGWLTGLFRSDTVGQESGTAYSITIENMLAEEKFAPILVVGDADDGKIWVGDYVSKEARTQFTIGNPSPLSDALGGDQSLPGKLGVGGKVTFEFKTSAKKARITAMVHPDKTPDNYVTALVDLKSGTVVKMERFDIGDDENRKTVEKIGPAGQVTVK